MSLEQIKADADARCTFQTDKRADTIKALEDAIDALILDEAGPAPEEGADAAPSPQTPSSSKGGPSPLRRATQAAAEAKALPKKAMQAHSLDSYGSNLAAALSA